MDQKTIKYRRALVTYIDLLGFKSLVKSENPSIVRKILTEFQETSRKNFVEDYSEIYGEPLYEDFIFSDSIIRITYLDHPINLEQPYGSVFYEILALAHALITLFPYGILFRGALTIGEVFADAAKGQIFGPALVQAVEIEARISEPCIAVSEEVLDSASCPHIRAEHNSAEEEQEFVQHFIADDSLICLETEFCPETEFHYIDIFKTADSETDYFPDWLIIIRNCIENNLNKYADAGHILAKYKWLKDQYNDYVSGLNENLVYEIMGFDKNRLLIS